AHGVANQSTALPVWDRAVMRVDIGHNVVVDKLLEIASGLRTRIHRAEEDRFRVGQDDDHLLRALCKCAFDCLRNVDLMTPLVGADEKTVQRVDHGIAPLGLLLIARWKEDDHVAIDGLVFEIALKRSAMDLDVLNRDRLRTRNQRGDDGLYLRRKQSSACEDRYRCCSAK